MMQKRQLLHLNEGDCIYVYSGGNLEAQGRYIRVVEDKKEFFLCWRKHNGNEVYTNLNGVSVETMNENTAYLQNTRETCERGYVDNQNTSSMYGQEYIDNYTQNSSDMYAPGYNDYAQNMNTTYQPIYDNNNPNASGTYDDGYNPNTIDSYNQSFSNSDQHSNCTCNQGYYGKYNPKYNNNYQK
ncbi:hypothetical protein [Bacillus thuringiensis]|nr:hypothetical protein [Bacillus thuringiensis]